jgi:hypothetical protein
MSATRTAPLVLVLYRVPLFVEGLTLAFDGVAHVQALRIDDGGVAGLLAALRPDAVIVEDGDSPLGVVGLPALHVDLGAGQLRTFHEGAWHELSTDLSPEAIRNALLAALVEAPG